MVSEVIFLISKNSQTALSTALAMIALLFFPFGPEVIRRGQRSSWGMQLPRQGR